MIMTTSFFNNKIHWTGLLLVAALAGSCKKLIEIPASPPTELSQAQQFSDSASTMSAVAGVYSYASYGHGFMYNDGYLAAGTGLSSDELSYPGSSDPDWPQFYSNTLTDLNNYVSVLWADPYTGLYQVNVILSNVASSSNLSASFKTRITGEMKVMRALYYFYTINLFGNCPLVLSTDYQATAHLPRISTDSVYAQVLSDLNDAKLVLTTDYPSSGRARPNLYVVQALLAKVQLYRQQWQAAYDAAGAVIGSGVYSLETDLNKVFLDGSNEAIWQVPAEGSNSVVYEAQMFIPYSSNTVPGFLIAPSLLNAFEAGDLRKQNWVADYVVNNGSSGNQHYYGPYKYKQRNPGSANLEDYMVFRLAELYLIHAEAAAHLGKTTEALADLNQVRQRAGLAASTAATANDLLTAIMHERQVELFTEWGSRWFDLKRTGTADAVLGAVKTGWQPYKTLYPIPRAQRQFNSALTQNPGY